MINELLDELIDIVENSGDSCCSIWRSQEDENRFYEIIEKIRQRIKEDEEDGL